MDTTATMSNSLNRRSFPSFSGELRRRGCSCVRTLCVPRLPRGLSQMKQANIGARRQLRAAAPQPKGLSGKAETELRPAGR